MTLTAIIIEDRKWSLVLDAWLNGRRAIHTDFGVPKTSELHGMTLYKGRGKYCETEAQNAQFGTGKRAAVGRIMLAELAKCPDFEVITLGMKDVSKPSAYRRLIAWFDQWAVERDTFVMVMYDGQQGLTDPHKEVAQGTAQELWETSVRDASPYRETHRDLDIATRRVVEDVIMQDSRYSQLIQAADLVAYGAFQLHRQNHPEIWGTKAAPQADAIRAYMKLSRRWPSDSDNGIYWLG